MKRVQDTCHVEWAGKRFDKFSKFTIKHQLGEIAEGSFTMGDESSLEELSSIVEPGQPFKVFVNDRPQLDGRADIDDVNITAGEGTTVTVTIHTKLSDAKYSSADPSIRVEKTSIADFLFAIFAPVGILKTDFQFNAQVNQDLMTGVSRGGLQQASLDQLQVTAAKVQPGETIWDAATRHLARHHYMLWETPDGKIGVGRPEDQQNPLYLFKIKKTETQNNNLKSARRMRDWSQSPARVFTYGGKFGKDVFKAQLGVVINGEVDDLRQTTGIFNRALAVVNQAARTKEAAYSFAVRSLSEMIKAQDTWDLCSDGLNYWDGHQSIGWALNTTCEVDCDAFGGPTGVYLIMSCQLDWDKNSGMETHLGTVKRGLYSLGFDFPQADNTWVKKK